MWQLTDIDQMKWMQKMKTIGPQVVDNEILYVEGYDSGLQYGWCRSYLGRST